RYTTETTTSILGFETTSRTITFVTKEGPAATIELDASGNATSASLTNIEAGTGTPVEQVGADVPEAYRLGQNYPNPFNPSTTIGYELKEAQPVRLSIHDLLGREVAVLVDAYQAAGGYDVTFEAGDLPSGLYLYRLEAGKEVRTRTMTLMK
ncbi:MAG: T9SS type A sorting domain-containing protein, partial [Rhodothermales bacterium]